MSLYAAVYVRISKDKTLEALGVERQVETLLELARASGYVPVVYADNDTSASDRTIVRPDYQRLVADLTAGKVHTVAAWDTSRLFRRPVEQEMFVELVEDLELERRVLFHSGGEKDLTDYTGQFEFRINGAVAARHVAEMKSKQRASYRQRAKNGRAFWPHRPFGFNLPTNKNGTGVTLRDGEYQLIADAYTDTLAGKSLNRIAKEWNALGVLTPKDNQWSAEGIRANLLAARNAGLRTYTKKKGTKTISTEIIGKADWPAIIDPEIYHGVVAKLKSRTRNPNAWTRKYLLSGLLYCGHCKARKFFVQIPCPTSRYKSAGYICKGCNKVRRDMKKVDDFVRTLVINALADQKAVELQLMGGIDVDKLNAKLAVLDKAEQELGLAMRGGMKYTVVQPQLDDINSERTAIYTQLETQPHRIKPMEKLLKAPNVAACWDDELTDDEKRAAIDTLFTITIYPGQRTGGSGPNKPGFNKELIVPKSKL